MGFRTKSIFSLVVGLLILPAVTRADLATVTLQNSFGTTGGGEFRATTSNFPVAPVGLGEFPGFETFCVEKNEYISFGTVYHVEINTAAINGGGPGAGGPVDPLDPLTAYLYSNFAQGTLTGYDYANTGVGRVTSANALQRVIWFLEDEETTAQGGWSIGDNSLMDQFYQDALANASNDIGSVRILNMWGDAAHTQQAQDQLVMFTPIPAPGAAALAVCGLSAIGWVRRRLA